MKETILRMFPNLKNEWEADGGLAVSSEYAGVWLRRQQLLDQWAGFAGDRRRVFRLEPEDLLLMQIGMVPDENDPRPVMTGEELRRLTDLYNRLTEDERLSRAEYRETMELLATRKSAPARSRVLMKRRFLVTALCACGLHPMGQQFECADETGRTYIADMVAVMQVRETECAVYMLPNEEDGLDFMVSQVEQGEDGCDVLRDPDPALRDRVKAYVMQRMNAPK